MEGGLDNPLGARALYLYWDGRDTLYRLHGTNEPWSIGRAVSSGCIRLFNHDIVDLHARVPVGAPVLVTLGGLARPHEANPAAVFQALFDFVVRQARALFTSASAHPSLGMRGCPVRQGNVSPGPYRSVRELSLMGSVDPDIRRPPTL